MTFNLLHLIHRRDWSFPHNFNYLFKSWWLRSLKLCDKHCCCCCRFSRVRLCATPETAAHQASPSLGFSRQEHWSGLPFPSPMHESEKWKWSRSVVPTLSDPMDYSLPGSSVHGFSRQEYWSGVPLPSPTKRKTALSNQKSVHYTCHILLYINYRKMLLCANSFSDCNNVNLRFKFLPLAKSHCKIWKIKYKLYSYIIFKIKQSKLS